MLKADDIKFSDADIQTSSNHWGKVVPRCQPWPHSEEVTVRRQMPGHHKIADAVQADGPAWKLNKPFSPFQELDENTANKFSV